MSTVRRELLWLSFHILLLPCLYTRFLVSPTLHLEVFATQSVFFNSKPPIFFTDKHLFKYLKLNLICNHIVKICFRGLASETTMDLIKIDPRIIKKNVAEFDFISCYCCYCCCCKQVFLTFYKSKEMILLVLLETTLQNTFV